MSFMATMARQLGLSSCLLAIPRWFGGVARGDVAGAPREENPGSGGRSPREFYETFVVPRLAASAAAAVNAGAGKSERGAGSAAKTTPLSGLKGLARVYLQQAGERWRPVRRTWPWDRGCGA